MKAELAGWEAPRGKARGAWRWDPGGETGLRVQRLTSRQDLRFCSWGFKQGTAVPRLMVSGGGLTAARLQGCGGVPVQGLCETACWVGGAADPGS